MPKIYVASKFENKEEVREAHRKLRAAGYEITFDWTPHDDSHAETLGLSRDEYLKQCALDDYNGVYDADYLVLIPYPNMRGAFIETGMAIAQGTPVLIVGDDTSFRNVFSHLSIVRHFASLENAMDWMRTQEINLAGH